MIRSASDAGPYGGGLVLGEALPHDCQPSVSQTDVVIFLNDHPVVINGELESGLRRRTCRDYTQLLRTGFRGIVELTQQHMGQLGDGLLLGHGMATRGYERGFGQDFLVPLNCRCSL